MRVDKERRDEIRAEAEVAVPDPLETIPAAAIGPIFGKSRTWFYAASTRDRLDRAGFPRPVSRGTWRKRDVVCFFLEWSAGLRPDGAARPRRRSRKR